MHQAPRSMHLAPRNYLSLFCIVQSVNKFMRFSLLIPVLILLTSCINGPNKSSENILARVYNEYLYESEIKDIVPPGTSVKDSLSIVQNYINNWISQKLFLHKAEKNLLEEDIQFRKQLDEYRNSLIIYQYESKLISQYLDTVVSYVEIEDYYNDNIGNFQLKDNIVKAFYARFESDEPNLAMIRRFFYSNKPESRDSLEVYIEKYADLYFPDDETWILFDDLLRFVPIKTYNKEAYLQNHLKIELKEDLYIYFVSFSDFKIKEGISPLSFEKENIRRIIINKRKLNIIRHMRDEVYQTALENNDFEIY
ncbi:MAG: hypothetical protein ISS18_02100 [Bacteroidales bacterium]|nr:hypothetical protein [Bacteroidales bacterium]